MTRFSWVQNQTWLLFFFLTSARCLVLSTCRFSSLENRFRCPIRLTRLEVGSDFNIPDSPLFPYVNSFNIRFLYGGPCRYPDFCTAGAFDGLGPRGPEISTPTVPVDPWRSPDEWRPPLDPWFPAVFWRGRRCATRAKEAPKLGACGELARARWPGDLGRPLPRPPRPFGSAPRTHSQPHHHIPRLDQVRCGDRSCRREGWARARSSGGTRHFRSGREARGAKNPSPRTTPSQ